ncbi:MAG: reverse transcriptase family protein, partial [Candidatus Thiodiazotropha sp.]
MSFNVEGVKGNASFLIQLTNEFSLICLQETWLWSFESGVIDSLIPSYDSFVRCSDMYDNISNFQVPRGKGGVAILWPKCWSNIVKRLEDGNERVQAVEVLSDISNVCIINAYLPTLNLPSSRESYQEMLDIVHSIISRFSGTHKIVFCGDLNGSLLPTRSNPHDVMLKDFVAEHSLCTGADVGSRSTFYGHSGSTSQIDYILLTDLSLLCSVDVDEPSPMNMSSHVSVKASLNIDTDTFPTSRREVKSKAIRKPKWDKVDESTYQCQLEETLQKSDMSQNPVNVLVEVLTAVSKKVVPHRLVKVKGPKFRLSPSVKRLESECKQVHYLWKTAGNPGPEHPLSIQRKQAKYNVRRQIRREFASARDAFYTELMENPSSKHFYRLIRRNQSTTNRLPVTLNVCGDEIGEVGQQCEAFAAYFEDLAVPKTHPEFDQEYLDLTLHQLDLIQELTLLEPDSLPIIDEADIQQAIKSLNNGKAPDEMGLSAEHLKYSGSVLLPVIADIFNGILRTKSIPEAFKSGIITPVHKKGKDPCKMDNYRGITVSSILGKLFETVILNRLEKLNGDQSQLQFGFTKGLSPTMASLILSEGILDSSVRGEPLYVAALDTQKAFDVVSHPILMKMLYFQGINSHFWQVIQSMYSGLTARVKWEGEVSQSFNVLQGVRQGGILSTHFYKAYLNDFLMELESRKLGKFIGSIYMGCPTVADDLLFMASSDGELQLMFSLAFINSQEKRYVIHPQKTTAQRHNASKAVRNNEYVGEWKLGTKEVNVDSKLTHLGLIRSEKSECSVNITERISIARRTLYALIKSGVHGSNGLNPRISYKIYQVYVIPRLLYSLEVLPLTDTQIGQLQRFHISSLRRMQSLPERTAVSAVQLLLGALPIQAELHKRQLSLLHSIVVSKNSRLKSLMERQLSLQYPKSFFCVAEKTL